MCQNFSRFSLPVLTVQSCDVSVVAGMDAKLDEWGVDDLVQCEDRIVIESRALLPAGFRGQIDRKVDELDELLRPLGLETQLVVLSRANSIALFFLCMTLSAVMILRDQWRTGRLRDIVRKFFTFLAGNTNPDGSTRDIYVKKLTWPLQDYERCCEFFHSLRGKQTIYSLTVRIICNKNCSNNN